MDTTTQNMLALLRISLSGKKPEIPAFTYKEWEDVYWLARKHGVVTMINDAIEMLPPDLQPQGDIALSWTLSAERTRYHFNHQTEVLELIDRKLDKGKKRVTIHLPYNKTGLLDELYREGKVENVEYGETVDVIAVCPPRLLGRMQDYIENWHPPKEDWE